MIKNKIIHEIKKKGKISIERFTEICLFDKRGFYSNSNPIGIKLDLIPSFRYRFQLL